MRNSVTKLLMALTAAVPLWVPPAHATYSSASSSYAPPLSSASPIIGVTALHEYERSSESRNYKYVRSSESGNDGANTTGKGSQVPVVTLDSLTSTERKGALLKLRLMTQNLEAGTGAPPNREVAGLAYWLLAKACLADDQCESMEGLDALTKANALGYFAAHKTDALLAEEIVHVMTARYSEAAVHRQQELALALLQKSAMAQLIRTQKQLRSLNALQPEPTVSTDPAPRQETIDLGTDVQQHASLASQVGNALNKWVDQAKSHWPAVLLGVVVGGLLRYLIRTAREAFASTGSVDMTRKRRPGQPDVNVRARFEKC